MIIDDSTWTPVMRLLEQSPRAPEDVTTRASQQELDELQRYLGFDLPGRLLQWLTRCNGLTCGPGGLFGTGAARPSLNIEHILRIFPAWQERRWIPVAGDGCGNHYILDAGRRWLASSAIYFVDVMDDPNTPAYCVASDLPKFLTFLLEKEISGSGWPFDRDFVVARDAEILAIADPALLPWN
jgi:hypothetical protein